MEKNSIGYLFSHSSCMIHQAILQIGPGENIYIFIPLLFPFLTLFLVENWLITDTWSQDHSKLWWAGLPYANQFVGPQDKGCIKCVRTNLRILIYLLTIRSTEIQEYERRTADAKRMKEKHFQCSNVFNWLRHIIYSDINRICWWCDNRDRRYVTRNVLRGFEAKIHKKDLIVCRK